MKSPKTKYKLNRIVLLVLVQYTLQSQAIITNLTPHEFFSQIYNSYKQDLKDIWNEIDRNVFHRRQAKEAITETPEDSEQEPNNYNNILQKEEIGKKKLGFNNLWESTKSFINAIDQTKDQDQMLSKSKVLSLEEKLDAAAEDSAHKIQSGQSTVNLSETPNYDHLSYEELLKTLVNTNNKEDHQIQFNQVDAQQEQKQASSQKQVSLMENGNEEKSKVDFALESTNFWNQLTSLQKKANNEAVNQARFITGVLGSDGQAYQKQNKDLKSANPTQTSQKAESKNESAKVSLNQKDSKTPSEESAPKSKSKKPVEIKHNEAQEKAQLNKTQVQNEDQKAKEKKKSQTVPLDKKEEKSVVAAKTLVKQEKKGSEAERKEVDANEVEFGKTKDGNKAMENKQKTQEGFKDQFVKEVLRDGPQSSNKQTQSKKPSDVLAKLQGAKAVERNDQNKEKEVKQSTKKLHHHKHQHNSDDLNTTDEFSNPLQLHKKQHHKRHHKHQHQRQEINEQTDEEEDHKQQSSLFKKHKHQKHVKRDHSNELDKTYNEKQVGQAGHNLKKLTEQLIKQQHQSHHHKKHHKTIQKHAKQSGKIKHHRKQDVESEEFE